MADESSVDGKRLVGLFKEASKLAGVEKEALLRRIREEDPALAASLDELLEQEDPLPTEVGSLAERIEEQYGSEADPHITLAGSGEAEADFTSEIVRRLAGRGQNYGRYRLKGEVARGGQGAILRVWDEDLRRSLAMKVVLGKAEASGGTPIDPRTLGRFLEEAQVTGQLDHPGIVPVHELGLDSEGQVYFTMKLVKGQDLRAIFGLVHEGKEGWTQTRALSVMLKVCEAMAYAHSKGVIHRDLKPGNVMVGKFGEVYVMDWGLARVLGQEDRKDIRLQQLQPALTTTDVRSDRREGSASPDSPLVTMDGDVVGTPAYMSPEQARGDLEAMGPHSDVYAVGAMLYHLLAGHMPYVPPGARLNNYAVWSHVQSGPPTPLERVAPDAPPELAAICEKAMRRDPEERYRDTQALAEDLRAFLEQRVVSAYETGAVAELRKWIARNQSLALASAAGVLALVAGLTASWILKGRSDRNAALAAQRERDAQKNYALAEERRKQAEENEERANREADEARRRRDEVLRLSALQKLDDLVAEADRLWPAHPENIDRFADWLARAEELMAELANHEAKLAELRERALPRSQADRERDRQEHPQSAELAQARVRLADLEEELERRLTEGTFEVPEALSTELDTSNARIEELERAVEKPWRWRFASTEDRWWHGQLEKLVDGLVAFADAETGLLSEGVSGEQGWGVRKRLAFAERLRDGYANGGEFAERWEAVLPELHRVYPGLDLTPQVGLVPLGPDPDSGLWEFGDLATGTPPERDEEGRLVLTQETGLVFVLLPGGMFMMGAQASDPSGPNYDPQASRDEGPPHEVTLSAFFLSKYEMTQGQWLRLAGRNPSGHDPTRYARSWNREGRPGDLWHPVERVSWDACVDVLARVGLVLPSEAQWEYGARGGMSSVWWTGDEKESLEGAANLADAYSRDHGGQWNSFEEWLNDGNTSHARIGSYAANAFGLHDVYGNVCEWCLDGYQSGFYRQSPETDPMADLAGSPRRVNRGGGYSDPAVGARSAFRTHMPPEGTSDDVGIRPARASTP